MAGSFLDVFVKIGADTTGLESGIEKSKNLAGSFASGLSSAVGTGMKVIGAAVAGATTAVTAFGASAVKNYAEYEQLVGGVSKLYGTAGASIEKYAESQGKSIDEVREKYDELTVAEQMMAEQANNAFRTAGMSANEYMETATSFSAALINSVGGNTIEAARLTDVAMAAISDNVNTFGSDMGSVTNAFQGFAKQNYTMLDNLKLGYGGTKQEMERLIEDANEYRASIGETADLSIDSFADVVEAIQSVQEAQNIAGTTNREAMTTIEGSANATKAAWENVITAIGRGEGLTEAFDGLITSLFGEKEGEGLLNQIIPRIETTMEGIGEFIATASPYITEKLPALINAVLPSAIESGLKLLEAIGQGLLDNLPTILDAGVQILKALGDGLKKAAPSLLKGAVEIIKTLGSFIIENAPSMISAITELVAEIATMLAENAPQVVEGVIALITGIAQAFIDNLSVILPAIVQLAIAIGLALIENLPTIIESVIELTIAFAKAVIDNAPLILDACVQVLMAIVELIAEYGGKFLESAGEAFNNLLESIGEWMGGLIEGISTWLAQLPAQMAYWAGYAIGEFLKFFIELPENLKTWFTETLAKVIEFGTEMRNKAVTTGTDFFNSLVDNIKKLPERLKQLAGMLVQAIANLPSKFAEVGRNIVTGLWNGLKEKWDWLTGKVKELAGSLLQGAKDALGIESPSKEFAYVGRMVDEGFAKGLDSFAYLIDNAMSGITDSLLSVEPQFAFANGEVAPASAGGYNQTVNIYSPTALTPSEVARQTRNATRDMVLELRGKR